MGEKQKTHDCENQKTKKKGGDGGGDNAKKEGCVTVVLKVEMHCEGCASKIIKCVKGFEGVERVKAEWEESRLIVVGVVDPAKIREKLADKTKKKVDLISPQPNKDDKKSDDKKKKPDEKKKEPPVTTAVLKLSLHCQGCIDKIHKILSKTDGIHEKCIDREKDLVTVKGTMDAKDLLENLKKNLKRTVEIVTPKKEKDGADKDKEGGDGGKKGKGGGGKEDNGGGAPKVDGNRMEYMVAPVYGYAPGDGYGYGYGHPYPYPYPYPPSYGTVYPVPNHQMFSDENPNACSVM